MYRNDKHSNSVSNFQVLPLKSISMADLNEKLHISKIKTKSIASIQNLPMDPAATAAMAAPNKNQKL